MNRQKILQIVASLLLLALAASACSARSWLARATATPVPTPTLYPTYTPYPTFTPCPTYTPNPTFTPHPTPTSAPVAEKGQWVQGHFFSIKVVDVRTATDLDGAQPAEDLFVVVEVDWKTNNATMWHSLSGSDFELVDAGGDIFEISGMILRPDNDEEPQGPGEVYDEGTYRTNKARFDADDTYKLVYDIPSTAQGLKLWFQDLAPIDLGLESPLTVAPLSTPMPIDSYSDDPMADIWEMEATVQALERDLGIPDLGVPDFGW